MFSTSKHQLFFVKGGSFDERETEMMADVYGEALSKWVQKLHKRSAIIVMNMSNEVDHIIALNTLGWKPLKAQREISKAKYILK